jgi:hypothetical protein
MSFRRSGSELIDTFTNIILLRISPLSNIYLSRPGIIDAKARYRAAARRLGNTALVYSIHFIAHITTFVPLDGLCYIGWQDGINVFALFRFLEKLSVPYSTVKQSKSAGNRGISYYTAWEIVWTLIGSKGKYSSHTGCRSVKLPPGCWGENEEKRRQARRLKSRRMTKCSKIALCIGHRRNHSTMMTTKM